jgi:hypothetical protein
MDTPSKSLPLELVKTCVLDACADAQTAREQLEQAFQRVIAELGTTPPFTDPDYRVIEEDRDRIFDILFAELELMKQQGTDCRTALTTLNRWHTRKSR